MEDFNTFGSNFFYVTRLRNAFIDEKTRGSLKKNRKIQKVGFLWGMIQIWRDEAWETYKFDISLGNVPFLRKKLNFFP